MKPWERGGQVLPSVIHGNVRKVYQNVIREGLEKPAPVKTWKEMTQAEKAQIMMDLERSVKH